MIIINEGAVIGWCYKNFVCYLFRTIKRLKYAKRCASTLAGISTFSLMCRSIAGHNAYNLFILTIDYSKNFTTMKLLTIELMAMFVVRSILFQMNGQIYGSINHCHVHCFSNLSPGLWIHQWCHVSVCRISRFPTSAASAASRSLTYSRKTRVGIPARPATHQGRQLPPATCWSMVGHLPLLDSVLSWNNQEL